MLASAAFPLLIKALATAAVVIGAARAAQALGPFWGALVACLPVSAGPAYVLLALRQGPDFVAASALGSAAANAATGLFLASYAVLGARLSAWRSLGVALATWAAASLLILALPWAWPAAALLNLSVYLPALRWLSVRSPAAAAGGTARGHWSELPLRAAAIAGFVVLLVAASTALGPLATGVAAVFPVSLLSLILLMRPRLGGGAGGERAAADAGLRRDAAGAAPRRPPAGELGGLGARARRLAGLVGGADPAAALLDPPIPPSFGTHPGPRRITGKKR